MRASLPFWGSFGGCENIKALYVVERRADVRERVTRSAVGASDPIIHP